MRIINKQGMSDYLIVFLGCIIQAFAVTAILRPNGLIVGGFTGISIVLGKLINIKYTYIYYTLCISVLVVTRIILGKKEALKIILLSITYPLILIYLDKFNLSFIEGNVSDKLLICIYYGVISGVGSGLILKKGFSQGSSDTLAKIIHRKIFPFMSISQILLAIDISILSVSGIVFGRRAVLYAIIMQAIYAKTIDTVMFGFGSTRVKIEIVSSESEEIICYILNTISRGVSTCNIKGGYSDKKKIKIISICSTRESILIKNFVAKLDKNAFIDVVHVISAWGRGMGLDELEAE